MKITLQTFGEMETNIPALSTCFDIVSLWSGNANRAQMGRICAIAICVCADSPKMPKTRHLTDIQAYGSRCLDFLLGADVTVDEILNNGVHLIGKMAAALPSSKEVEETENFTEQPPPEVSSE